MSIRKPKVDGSCLFCGQRFTGTRKRKFCEDMCRTRFRNTREMEARHAALAAERFPESMSIRERMMIVRRDRD